MKKNKIIIGIVILIVVFMGIIILNKINTKVEKEGTNKIVNEKFNENVNTEEPDSSAETEKRQ